MSTTVTPPNTAADTKPPKWLTWSTRYTDHVAEICTTPGGRADLSSGHSLRALAEPWRMLPHVRSRIPKHAGETKIAYLAVAAMFAVYAPNPATNRQPQTSTYNHAHGNFGWSLGRAVHTGVLRQESATELLKSLARQRRLPALIRQLQPVIRQLTGAKVPLSWPRLLNDLTRWPTYRTDIADRWMYSHYAPTTESATEEQTA